MSRIDDSSLCDELPTPKSTPSDDEWKSFDENSDLDESLTTTNDDENNWADFQSSELPKNEPKISSTVWNDLFFLFSTKNKNISFRLEFVSSRLFSIRISNDRYCLSWITFVHNIWRSNKNDRTFSAESFVRFVSFFIGKCFFIESFWFFKVFGKLFRMFRMIHSAFNINGDDLNVNNYFIELCMFVDYLPKKNNRSFSRHFSSNR